MKKAYFYIDDTIWVLRDITRLKPKSIFDNSFISFAIFYVTPFLFTSFSFFSSACTFTLMYFSIEKGAPLTVPLIIILFHNQALGGHVGRFFYIHDV